MSTMYMGLSTREADAPEPVVTVERGEKYWVVRSDQVTISNDDLTKYGEEASAAGFSNLHPGVSHAISCAEYDPARGRVAVFAMVPSDQELVDKICVGLIEAIPADLDAVDRWLRGPSYGLSAANLAYCLTGKLAPNERIGAILNVFPVDIASFNRCREMMSCRPDLWQMAAGMVTQGGWMIRWEPYISAWGDLSMMADAGAEEQVANALRLIAGPQEKRIYMKQKDGEASMSLSQFCDMFRGPSDGGWLTPDKVEELLGDLNKSQSEVVAEIR